LVESFFIIIKIFYDDENINQLKKEALSVIKTKAEISKFKENLISEEEQSDIEFKLLH